MNKLDLLRRSLILRLLSKYIKFNAHIDSGVLYLNGKLSMGVINQLPETTVSIVSEFLYGAMSSLFPTFVDSTIQISGDIYAEVEQMFPNELTTLPIVIALDVESDVIEASGELLEDVYYVSFADVTGSASLLSMNPISASDKIKVYLVGNIQDVETLTTKPTSSIIEMPIKGRIMAAKATEIEGYERFNVLVNTKAQSILGMRINDTNMKAIVDILTSMAEADAHQIEGLDLKIETFLSELNMLVAKAMSTKLDTELVHATISANANESISQCIKEAYQHILATIESTANIAYVTRIVELSQQIVTTMISDVNMADVSRIKQLCQKILASIDVDVDTANALLIDQLYQEIIAAIDANMNIAKTTKIEELYQNIMFYNDCKIDISPVATISRTLIESIVKILVSVNKASAIPTNSIQIKLESLDFWVSAMLGTMLSAQADIKLGSITSLSTVLQSILSTRLSNIDIHTGSAWILANIMLGEMLSTKSKIKLGNVILADTILRQLFTNSIQSNSYSAYMNISNTVSQKDTWPLISNHKVEMNDTMEVNEALVSNLFSNTKIACSFMALASVSTCRLALLTDYAQHTLAQLSGSSLEALYYIDI